MHSNVEYETEANSQQNKSMGLYACRLSWEVRWPDQSTWHSSSYYMFLVLQHGSAANKEVKGGSFLDVGLPWPQQAVNMVLENYYSILTISAAQYRTLILGKKYI